MSEKTITLQETLKSMEKEGGIKVHSVSIEPMQEFNAVKLTLELRLGRRLSMEDNSKIIEALKKLFE